MIEGRFEDIRAPFAILNANQVNYLVLRNYENMLQPKLFVGDHADVDLLCANNQEIVKLLGAKPNRGERDLAVDDGIHYYIIANGKKVSFDLRQVGDGYYCEKWENELLQRKKLHECFYVMDDKDYFYTLAYHAILQKRNFSEEYRLRLSEMASSIGINLGTNNERGFLDAVEQYMQQNGYCFTYSKDYLVPNRFGLVKNKSLIQQDRYLRWKHKKFDCEVWLIESLVSLKHFFERSFGKRQ